MLAAILLVIFLLVVVLGVPIGFAMGFMTISAFTLGDGAMVIIPQKMFSGVYNFTYMCIPLFILASEIMSRCGLTMSIVKFCDTLVGHIRGGLAHVNVLASMMFAGISGSATADATGLGRIEMEMMTKAGYEARYSASVTAASAIIGPIVPPSNIMIIYAVCASNVSVSAMFLGGVGPGILLGLSEMLLCYYFARKYNHPCRSRRAGLQEILHSLKRSLPALGLPVIILGGIVSGVFTATESSAVAVFYALVIAVCKRQITWHSLFECCKNTAKTTANVMLIISIASAMSYAITVLRIPQAMIALCMEYVHSPAMFLLLVNIILLILGCVLDQSPALLMMTPILLPIAMKYGIDPVHFGVLCCFNLTIGLITPPIGMTLFVTANVAKVKLTDIFRGIIPFVFVGLAVLCLITWFPALTTFIPGLFS
ncbi:MAG: TRAP transporter large permease [Lachnospiraceae bacterium]|jgi:tripartite ATP-independent transporter DctM subunit|nr:TRAP transporter large permease [Lachnospiraceae bacterium]